MRLQLTLVGAVLAWATPARAQEAIDETEPGAGKLDSELALYADDDATTVVSTMVGGDVRLPVPVIVDAHALVDAVSSASVDVVSAATPRWTENRIELGARARARAGELEASLAYVTSGENDWRSHAVTAGVSRALADDNATLQLGYGYTTNQIGRAFDPTFERSLGVHAAEVGLTQILGPRTLGSVAYTLQRADGYQSSPYRFVTAAGGVTVPETHPTDRTRHAVTLRLMRAVGEATSLDSSYRLYVDGWGVASHTAQLALTRELTETLDLRVRGRAYYQGSADFYEEQYAMPMRYMSADRELSRFWDVGGGVKLAWFGESFELALKADGVYYRFLDFARLTGRVAIVTGGGLTWRW